MCMRRKKDQINSTVASNFLNDEYVDDSIQHNQGYRFLENLPSSPSYGENENARMLAAIRQLGMPTLFITFSAAAETQWTELLVILPKVVDNKDISIKEAEQLTFGEKARLIRTDPVTCS